LYCFHASGEIDSSSHWVIETGTSRAWLTTLRTTAGSSTGVEYRYCGPEVSAAAVFSTAVVGIFLAVVVMTGY
jgi:hypothetical protein